MTMWISNQPALRPAKSKRALLGYSVLLASMALANSGAAASDLWDLSLAQLGRIRITTLASGTQTPLDKAAAVATVITADDIAAMGATDIDQVLETIPGLHVGRSDQAYTPKYIIRGITSTHNPQTLMLINGIPITSLFTGNRSNVWGGMPIKAIARIEVIRGPGSALYGADAFAGVINVITKKREDINGTVAGARSGSFNTKAVWLEHGGSYGDTDIGFSLEAETTDGWRKIIESDRQTGFDSAFGTQASLAPGVASTMKKMVEARLDIAHDDSRLRAGYQGRFNVGMGPGIAEALDPHGRVESERFNIDYTHTLNKLIPAWEMEARASYYHNTQVITDDVHLFPPGAFGGAYPNAFIGNPGFQEENARFDFSSLYKGLAKHYIRLGSGFYWGDIFEVTESKNFYPNNFPRPAIEDVSDSAETYLPEKGRTSYYAFAQDEWKMADRWQLTSGLRYDHFSDFGSTINPRVALVWAATDNMTTRLLYGKAFRAPSIVELYTISNPVVLGNEDLEPEQIDNYELAFSHQLSSKLLYTANVYYYKIKDYIAFVTIAPNTNQSQNVGKRKGRGFELEADYNPLYNLRLLANYAYQKSIDEHTHADIGEAPNHQVYVRSEWEVRPDWLLNSQVTWVGEQKRMDGDSRAALEDYTTVDVTLRKRGIWQKMELALSVHDLFNASIFEPSPGLPAYIPKDFPMAGRSVYGEISYHF